MKDRDAVSSDLTWFAGQSRPNPMGVTLGPEGANIAVFSQHAEAVELCLFAPDGVTETARAPLPERTGSVWHGLTPDLGPGGLYGLRVYGPFAPKLGHRFNPAKLLLDPYARALSGPVAWHPGLRGDLAGDPLSPDPEDSASLMPKCVALSPDRKVDPAERPNTPWERTVIYEAHVKGLTQLWPGMPDALRGTYEALGVPKVIEHLRRLGITAVELLPIHAFADEPALLDRGLSNYWGYNSFGFFMPESRYLGPNGPAGLRETIRRLHAAGIEVILDVVYNHTAESDVAGPTLSFRGLDNASYYRLIPDAPQAYVNDTGCGNTVNAAHPFVMRLILDSLRWWVEVMGVDGFRFDLAPALAREEGGVEMQGRFLSALRQDPVLSGVKLIVEPWDIGPGGHSTGAFPAGIAEWNDRYRDTVRGFWAGEAGAGRLLADALLGTADLFDKDGRPAWSSINFITAHDGFTLADLTAYAEKHNQANGEGNRDGHGHNLSDNLGAEGPTDDPAILAARGLRRRNLLATLMLSQGTPMLLAGDEIGKSQAGNNNAYCQDNEIGWIAWQWGDAALLSFLRRLTALRGRLPVLRQPGFLHGSTRADGAPDVAWQAPDGGPPDWPGDGPDALVLILRGAADAALPDPNPVAVAVNRGADALSLHLPSPAQGRRWMRVLDTTDPTAAPQTLSPDGAIAAASVTVFVQESLQ
ncbi:MAG: glycogen debranching protein GlgX [Pseudomonadota bacterium]